MQKYDGTAMGNAVTIIRNTHNTLVQYRDDLNRYLQSNVTSQWEGQASYAYQAQQQQWDTACDDVQLMLENLYNALEIAMGNAGGIEYQLERYWS